MEQIKSEVFAVMLKKYKVLFEKSKTPVAIKAKSQALAALQGEIAGNFGLMVEEKSLLKRINNMKMRFKQKTDLRQRGNKPIVLKEWEKNIFDIMGGETNPVLNRIEGAAKVGVASGCEDPLMDFTVIEEAEVVITEMPVQIGPSTPKPPRGKSILEQYETDETKLLSNSELQRLVLLKQLELLNKQLSQ